VERRRGGFTAGVGRRGGGDGADKRAPRVTRWIERRRQERKARTQGGSALLHLRQRRARAERLGLACGLRPAEEEGPAGGPKAEWAARSAGPKARKKNF
jgi:hypothetical protein